MQDKTQTYLVSILNLLYLVYQRDRLARKVGVASQRLHLNRRTTS